MRILIVIMTLMMTQVLFAQSVTVENFKHHKHYFWQINSSLPLEKNVAIVLLKTGIKGFEFKTANDNPIDFEEGDEGVILKAPDKTKYIIISHPEFGEYAWRVPVKNLKKHNYYSAELSATDLTKEFKNPNQWLVINTSPENAILTMDSTMHRIANGVISLYLPLGKHSFTLESPFYEALTDSVILTDSGRVEKKIFLQPLYSYLSVKTDDDKTEIYVDEELQGSCFINVGRLAEGNHRVSLLKNNQWVKDTIVTLERAEKKTLIFPENYSNGNTRVLSEKFEKNPVPNIYRKLSAIKKDPEKLLKELKNQGDSLIQAPVHLMAENPLSVIRIDREIVGIGEWEGTLEKGFHLISTEKDGIESISQYIEITDSEPREINLSVPQSSVGILNIHSNIDGVDIFFNDIKIGETPFVLKEIHAGEFHTLIFRKDGFREKRMQVRPEGNVVTEVYVEMKKK